MSLEIGVEMGVVLALILQLVKLCIIGFVVEFQGSEGRYFILQKFLSQVVIKFRRI